MADLLEEIGLKPGEVKTQFNPISTTGLFGGVNWNRDEFGNYTNAEASLDPRLADIKNRLFWDLGNLSPQSELDLLRKQAAPFQEQQRLALENRLFAQGRMGASSAYRPGGEMRGLFDSFGQQDLSFQQQAMQNARAKRIEMLNSIFGLGQMENNMFAASAGLSGLSQSVANQNAQMQMQQNAFMPNMLWSLGGGALQGGLSGGYF